MEMKFQCVKTYAMPFDFDAYIDRALASAPPPDMRAERETRAARITEAGRVVDRAAREHIAAHGGTYRDAVHAVLAADPALKAAYIHGDAA